MLATLKNPVVTHKYGVSEGKSNLYHSCLIYLMLSLKLFDA